MELNRPAGNPASKSPNCPRDSLDVLKLAFQNCRAPLSNAETGPPFARSSQKKNPVALDSL